VFCPSSLCVLVRRGPDCVCVCVCVRVCVCTRRGEDFARGTAMLLTKPRFLLTKPL
jgi:hypothetical protein